jgi:Fe2+ or Zn2+ uptake regulation protein
LQIREREAGSVGAVRSPAELIEAFRARGLKVTPQRQLIFRILHGNDRHPTAEAVHDAAVAELTAISLRTAYQTLNDLSAMGEIQTLELGTGSARFDPHVADHHHLVCVHCGGARDVMVEGVEALETADDMQGFTIATTKLVSGARARLAASAREEGARPAPQPTADNEKEQPRCRI